MRPSNDVKMYQKGLETWQWCDGAEPVRTQTYSFIPFQTDTRGVGKLGRGDSITPLFYWLESEWNAMAER